MSKFPGVDDINGLMQLTPKLSLNDHDQSEKIETHIRGTKTEFTFMRRKEEEHVKAELSNDLIKTSSSDMILTKGDTDLQGK